MNDTIDCEDDAVRRQLNAAARVELEQRLLGWMINDAPGALALAGRELRGLARGFDHPNDVIALAMLAARDDGRQVAPRTIAAELGDVPALRGIGFDYLVRLAQAAPAYASPRDLEQMMRQTIRAWRRVAGPRAQAGSLDVVNGADLEPREVTWLWPGWLACGKFTLLAGSAGTGKTTIALALAATITSGGRFPGGAQAEEGDVLVWSGEDDLNDSILPRLMANGGVRGRIHMVRGVHEEGGGRRMFDPATDMEELLAHARSIPNLKLVIIDPVILVVTGDSHKNAETRRGLQPLIDFAARTGVALLGITHYSKGTSGRDPVERVTGSLAFTAVARLVMATAKPKDPTDSWRLVRAKSNIGPDGGGFEYDLRQTAIDAGIMAQSILWGDALEGTAQSLLADVESPEECKGAREDAEEFLRNILVPGPASSRHVEEEARRAGHSMATLRRAKKALGVVSVKTAGGWVCQLPKELKALQDVQTKK